MNETLLPPVETDFAHKIPVLLRGRESFVKVTDSRKRPIRGLWIRSDRYYAQMSLMDYTTGTKRVRKVPLMGVNTVSQAVVAMNQMIAERRDGKLVVSKVQPTFRVAADHYLAHERSMHDGKRVSTLRGEAKCLRSLAKSFSSETMDKIKPLDVRSHISRRQRIDRVCGRTVNHELVVLANLVKHCRIEFGMTNNPLDGVVALPYKSDRRPLPTTLEIQTLCDYAVANMMNGQLLSDFVRFLASTGARRSEALVVAWSDVDTAMRRVCIGGYRKSKNGLERYVDFNPALESLMAEMKARKDPDSLWLFPTPRGGDIPSSGMEASFAIARKATKPERIVGWHSMRHYFASQCVMAGIDFMTIAAWLGHRDGGILLGKVYGHLNDSHRQSMAAKLLLAA